MVDHQGTRSLVASVATVGAVAVGVAGAIQPAVLLGVLLLTVAGGLLVLSWRFPGPALVGWVFILLIAGTKFRYRDATASLAGAVDSQVIFELSLYALLAVAFGVIWRSRRLRLGPVSRVELLLFGYVVLAMASTVWSAAPLLTAARAAQLWVLLFAALVLVRGLPPDRLLHTLSTPLVCYVLTFAGLAALWPSAAGGTVQHGLARFSWFAVHPIAAATLAGIAALILGLRLLARPLEKYAVGRVWLWLAVIALVVIALLTRSRGPLIALLGAVTVGLTARRLTGATAALLGFGVVVGALLIANSGVTLLGLLADWSTDQGAVSSLLFRGQGADAVAGLSGRMRLWADALPLVLEEPWLGRGFQAARAELLQLATWSGHAHNAVLQSLLDLGFLGTLLLFVAFGSMFLVGPLRLPSSEGRLGLVRVTVLGIGMFELLNAVANQSFVGAPGYETLVVFTFICLAERLRHLRPPSHFVGPAPFGHSVAAAAPSSPAYGGTAATVPSTSSP